MKPVIIYGTTVLAKMLYYDAIDNPDFLIAAFTADSEFISGNEFVSLSLVPFDQVEKDFPPEEYDMVAAVAGSSDMRGHASYFLRAKEKGYTIRSYISRRACVTPGTSLGENSLVFPFAYIGPEGMLAENVIVRQNAYLGHNISVGAHSFIGVGCHIGGGCTVGPLSYLSIGSTISDHIVLGRETLVGAGSVVINDTLPFSKVVGNPARLIGTHEDEGIKINARN